MTQIFTGLSDFSINRTIEDAELMYVEQYQKEEMEEALRIWEAPTVLPKRKRGTVEYVEIEDVENIQPNTCVADMGKGKRD